MSSRDLVHETVFFSSSRLLTASENISTQDLPIFTVILEHGTTAYYNSVKRPCSSFPLLTTLSRLHCIHYKTFDVLPRRSNLSSKLSEDCVTFKDQVSVRKGCLTEHDCEELGWNLTGTACHDHRITHAVPDVFLLSVILTLGTFGLAVFLRGSRSGRWFPAIVSHFGLRFHDPAK